ncbi:hypothetical protein AB5J56_23310 [Streptomyces sp. R21]|uniref:Uncharacterized protein n=1 Tax=Streptomyces sp. R21 TaxID=3238627 RepID=A0AB39PAR4_9ACTN
MDLESAMSLHLKLLDSLVTVEDRSLRKIQAMAQCAGPSDEGPPMPISALEELGLGITSMAGHLQYALSIHVHVDTPEAWETAHYLKEEAEGEARILYVGRAVAQATTAGAAPTLPLRPGLSVGHEKVTYGTLGAFVASSRHSDGIRFLSNNHVLAACDRGIRGDDILQPGPHQGGRAPRSRIGALDEKEELHRDGVTPNTMDAALCLLDGDVSFDLGELGGLSASIPPPVAVIGSQVSKVGSTTDRTTGTVIDIGFSTKLWYQGEGYLRFDDLMVVAGKVGQRFSRGGDSGALVFRPDSREPVGLHIGGTELDETRGIPVSYVAPLEPILKKLRVTLIS